MNCHASLKIPYQYVDESDTSLRNFSLSFRKTKFSLLLSGFGSWKCEGGSGGKTVNQTVAFFMTFCIKGKPRRQALAALCMRN